MISEFMAANSRSHADNDGTYSDWIELHNPDAQAISLDGWYLTDSAGNKTKWKLPAVSLPAGGYLVVYASNKNRTDASAPLHTNFALSADGEYLGLVKPDGVTVASEFAPAFPAQADDVSYSSAGFLSSPTPGSANSGAGSGGGGGVIDEVVTFSRASGLFRNSFLLELSGASGDQQIRYIVSSGANAGAGEVTSASTLYTGPVTIQSSSVVRAAIFDPAGKSGPVATASFNKLGSTVTNFSSQLPVLVIDSLGSGPLVKDGIDHLSVLSVYAPRGGASPTFAGSPELVTPMESSVRGSSSADFPKKGYNVKLLDASGDKSAQSVLGMPAADKWAFVGPWSFDFSYINNSLAYAISNQMGRWAPRTRLAEIFFNADGNDLDNSDYAGVYALTDRIEVGDERVDITKLSSKDVSGDAVTGGYIIKIDPKDPDEIGWTTPHSVTAESSIVLVAPKAEDIVPAQLDYLQTYVLRMETALLRDQATGFAQRTYLDYIDRASWVDYHLLTVFTANPDGLVRSTYFHKDRKGKLAAGPVWDFDRALGSFWDARSQRWDVWSGIGAPDYWSVGWWGIVAKDPEFVQDWIDRWQALRRTTFSKENLAQLVDSLGATIGEAAALRDATRWPDNAPNLGSHAAQITEKRNWVTDRAWWIDHQFVAAPTVAESGGSLTFTPPAGAKLAYTLDGSDPRSLGGALAPNAIVATGPVTVEAHANVHVRAYQPDRPAPSVAPDEPYVNNFPGSPWSASVDGQQSSPLTPKARLINISSRATVGSGENALIAGVVVADTEGKRYLSRAIGPGLAAFGAAGTVPDPQLSIFASNGVELFRNNGWETGLDATRIPTYAKNVGAFPLAAGSKDSALASQIASGGYTVQITTPSGQSGIGPSTAAVRS
ncbi:MAG: CotH kinase family protein, partial [Verrucomicrobiota bacterium]